jgi:hypothetical protein
LLSQSNDNEEWSDFAELPEDNMKKKKDSSASPKLGIDLQLDPLTEQEAEDLKAEATELINEKIAQGVDDIRKLRADLQKELLESQKLSQLQSELRTQQESERLMSRIDRLTEDFLSQTELSRKSTKLAAQADQQSSGRGLEYGSWGVLEGGSVVRMQDGGVGALLGSVDAAKKKSVAAATSRKDELVESTTVAAAAAPRENRILIVADESQVCRDVPREFRCMHARILTLTFFHITTGCSGESIASSLYRLVAKSHSRCHCTDSQTNSHCPAGR